mmetsp:Transcript_25024/g.71489  ORF Transcript_25024/g.71489 Transcript_25024/m.71489 type:complete len:333 (-) Transcript_25024:485-1483(-)
MARQVQRPGGGSQARVLQQGPACARRGARALPGPERQDAPPRPGARGLEAAAGRRGLGARGAAAPGGRGPGAGAGARGRAAPRCGAGARAQGLPAAAVAAQARGHHQRRHRRELRRREELVDQQVARPAGRRRRLGAGGRARDDEVRVHVRLPLRPAGAPLRLPRRGDGALPSGDLHRADGPPVPRHGHHRDGVPLHADRGEVDGGAAGAQSAFSSGPNQSRHRRVEQPPGQRPRRKAHVAPDLVGVEEELPVDSALPLVPSGYHRLRLPEIPQRRVSLPSAREVERSRRLGRRVDHAGRALRARRADPGSLARRHGRLLLRPGLGGPCLEG